MLSLDLKPVAAVGPRDNLERFLCVTSMFESFLCHVIVNLSPTSLIVGAFDSIPCLFLA